MIGDVSTVIKTTNACNLRCSYCYLDSTNNDKISLDVVSDIIKQTISHNRHWAKFSWVGGEPLLLGIDFFESVVKIEQETNRSKVLLRNSIQTNGLLLDEKSYDRVSSLTFKVGVSYDGLEELQVRHRGRNGKKVQENLRRLVDTGREFNTITVLSRLSKGRIKEIYQTLKGMTKNASFNLYTPIGRGEKNQDILLPTPDEMGCMLIELYDEWFKDPDSKFMINPFVNIVKSMTSGRNNICEYSGDSCSKIISFDPMGDAYICSRGAQASEYFLGNISEGIVHLLESDILSRVIERRERLKELCACEYFDICNGGCPHEASHTQGDFFSKSYYCDSKRALFDHIKESVQ